MPQQSISDAFLAHEGIALFEYRGGSAFRPVGKIPDWCSSIWGARNGKSLELAEKSLFLETFLGEAEEFWKFKAPGKVESGSWTEQDSEGREIPLEASAVWLKGKRVLQVRNLSETFAQQQQLFQTARDSLLAHEQLMREIQKKEILLHCIIHDLSQPLTSMRACFDLLLGKDLDPAVAKFVNTGRAESQRQERMIREVLGAFSADLAGEKNLGQGVSASTNLIASAQRAVEQFAPAFAARGVQLVLAPNADSEFGWRVIADATRLDRIFGNLLENALRYSPRGSTVTVRVEGDRKALTALVIDQGPGLAKDATHDQLFALFSKGKDRPGKAGLGLYFCKMTVERWGGEIGAENRAEGGSRFWFRLPRSQQVSDAQPGGSAANPVKAQSSSNTESRQAEKSLRIVVADDDATIRELAIELLRARGHSVTDAADGPAALTAFDRTGPDVMLLDQQMPGMDGLEVARVIRQREEQAGAAPTRIVGLSGNASAEDERRSRDAGMDVLLGKPFERNMLFRAVERALETVPASTPASIAEVAPQEENLRAHLLHMTGGNEKLMRKLVAGFLADLPAKLSAIRRAVSKKDADELAAAAHSLRGAIATFNAQKAVAATRNLETMGRTQHLENVPEEFRTLSDDLVRLKRDLRALYPDASSQAKRRGAS